MVYYINRQEGRYNETCDEYTTRTEAYAMLREYQVADHGRAYYYLSTTPKSNWNWMPESNIILAVIGCVGLLSTLAVYSRANNANSTYEKRLLRQRNVNRLAHEDEWLSSCNGCTVAIYHK